MFCYRIEKYIGAYMAALGGSGLRCIHRGDRLKGNLQGRLPTRYWIQDATTIQLITLKGEHHVPSEKEKTCQIESCQGKCGESGDINKLKRDFATNLFYVQGKTTRTATLNNYYIAVAYTVRDRMQHLFVNSVEALLEKKSKTVYCLSAEFLMGPHLGNNLINLRLYEEVAQAVGTPMLSMGDEVRRTQQGNNNVYCQDNELSWFDWSMVEKQAGLLRFVKKLVQFRLSQYTP